MRFGSLFSGVGGMDLGFEAAGMTPTFMCEIDQRCRMVLRRHWPDVPCHDDVTTLDGATLPEVDLIAWGSPCQDLSVAGNRAGMAGERSGLFHEGMRVIREMREATDGRSPAWSVWENVEGALSSNQGRDFGVVIDAMGDAGAVVVEWAVLDGQFFGPPQRRKRVFVVAGFDPATACPDPLLPVGEGSAGDSSQGREAGEEPAGGAGDRVAATLNSGGNSGGFRTEPGEHLVPFVKVVRSGARAKDGSLPAEVWAERETAPTMTAFDGGEVRATVLANQAAGVRRLTPVECERLMGWPDDHTAWGVTEDGERKDMPDSTRYRMVGNGVMSPVAEWIGRQIIDHARGASDSGGDIVGPRAEYSEAPPGAP